MLRIKIREPSKNDLKCYEFSQEKNKKNSTKAVHYKNKVEEISIAEKEQGNREDGLNIPQKAANLYHFQPQN